MSIRLRLSLLYTAILALTLAVFGLALYTAQARTTLRAFQDELVIGSRRFSEFRPPRPDLDEPPSLPEDLERLDRRVGPIYFCETWMVESCRRLGRMNLFCPWIMLRYKPSLGASRSLKLSLRRRNDC